MTKKSKQPDWYEQLKIELGNDCITIGRTLVKDRFPGIDEKEAIAYARGFTNGLIAGGSTPDKAMEIIMFCSIKDALLDAGTIFLGINMVESIHAQKNAKIQ